MAPPFTGHQQCIMYMCGKEWFSFQTTGPAVVSHFPIVYKFLQAANKTSLHRDGFLIHCSTALNPNHLQSVFFEHIRCVWAGKPYLLSNGCRFHTIKLISIIKLFHSSKSVNSVEIMSVVPSPVLDALEFEKFNRVKGSVLEDPFYHCPSELSQAVPGTLLKVEKDVNITPYLIPAVTA